MSNVNRKYRKKPVVIEACRWTGLNLEEMAGFLGYPPNAHRPAGHGGEFKLLLPTLEGVMEASVGDWVIRGVNGEYYPCKPDIFEKTYDRVLDD